MTFPPVAGIVGRVKRLLLLDESSSEDELVEAADEVNATVSHSPVPSSPRNLISVAVLA